VPIHSEKGTLTGRVAFGVDEQIAGLFVLDRESAAL
jgi:hypothetical protein